MKRRATDQMHQYTQIQGQSNFIHTNLYLKQQSNILDFDKQTNLFFQMSYYKNRIIIFSHALHQVQYLRSHSPSGRLFLFYKFFQLKGHTVAKSFSLYAPQEGKKVFIPPRSSTNCFTANVSPVRLL